MKNFLSSISHYCNNRLLLPWMNKQYYHQTFKYKLQMLHKCPRCLWFRQKNRLNCYNARTFQKFLWEMAKKAGQHTPPRRSHTAIPSSWFAQQEIAFSDFQLCKKSRWIAQSAGLLNISIRSATEMNSKSMDSSFSQRPVRIGSPVQSPKPMLPA